MSFTIAGRTALVTGANRGIGAALVDALVAAGAAKVYAAARTLADLDPLVARHAGRVVPVQLDVTKPAQIAAAVAATRDVDFLINNAGVSGAMFAEFTDAQWIAAGREEIEVNYFGTFAVTQAYAPVLAANGGGAIANVASIASLVNYPALLAYSASKAALHSLTQGTRILLQGQGTQVFGIYPGPIDTRMAADIPMEKTSPADAARAILAGIAEGTEEIFPDAFAVNLGTVFLRDPKGLERQIAGMSAATTTA